MYNVYHKSVIGSLERTYESFQEGFKVLPTIALSLHQNQVVIEDEVLDSRINANRLTRPFQESRYPVTGLRDRYDPGGFDPVPGDSDGSRIDIPTRTP